MEVDIHVRWHLRSLFVLFLLIVVIIGLILRHVHPGRPHALLVLPALAVELVEQHEQILLLLLDLALPFVTGLHL